MTHYDTYFKGLSEYNPSDGTEHSHRGELRTLLKDIAGYEKLKLTIIHEPKRDRIHGAPDYLIKDGESIVGYVENKKIDDNLRQVLNSDQIKKYKELSKNILLSNYHEFVWIKNGKIITRESLFDPDELGNKKYKLDPQKVEKVNVIIKGFLSQNAEGIGKPQKLAEALAIRAKYLKDILLEELTNQKKNNNEGRLLQLYDTFKQHVFHELTVAEFADAFAQNLAYGLFLAKLNAGHKPVGLYGAKQYIPHSFELIAELVNFLDELERKEYQETKWIVEEILSILNNLNLQEIGKGLFYHSTKSQTLFGEDEFSYRDPFVYFYELFLAKYDKKLRKSKGVYYTPPASR